MNNDLVSRPAMTIDFKKNRIRIYKKTIHLINNPEYILLLINPREHTLAILRGDCSDLREYRLPLIRLKGRKTFEITSKSLVRCLFDMCCNWTDKRLYHVYGNIKSNEGAVEFNLAESTEACGRRG